MLTIAVEAGHHVPRFVCDICRRPITDARAAAVVHANFLPDESHTTPMQVHKNLGGLQCMAQAERELRALGRTPGWEELSTFLAYLVDNSGLSVKDISLRLARPDS